MPMKLQKNLPGFVFVFNTTKERPSLNVLEMHVSFSFHLEFVLTSEAPFSLKGFFQSVQGSQSWVPVAEFTCPFWG